MSEPTRRLTPGLLLRLAISLGLLAWLLTALDLRDLVTRFAALRPGPLVLAIGLGILDRAICTWRWRLLLGARGVHFGFWWLLRVQLTACFIGTFLPTTLAPDALRIVSVAGKTSRRIDVVTSSITDRAVMVFTTFGVALVGALASTNRYFPPSVTGIIVGLLAAGLIAIVLLGYTEIARYPAAWLRRLHGERLRASLAEAFHSFRAFRSRPGTLAAGVALSLIAIVVRVAITYCGVLALGAELGFLPLAAVLPVVWIILMLPISIGGIGLQEGAFLLLLTRLGVEPELAVGISLLEHVLARLINLPGLAFYMRHGLAANPTPDQAKP